MLLAVLLSIVAVIFAVRKSETQSFVSVEDFWWGALIGFLIGYSGTAASENFTRVRAAGAQLAKEYGLHAGNTVQVQLSHGQPHTMTVVGIFQATDVSRGWLVSPASNHDFELKQPVGGYLRVTDGASVEDVRKQVDKLLVDSPGG
jgi:hypothetical protein